MRSSTKRSGTLPHTPGEIVRMRFWTALIESAGRNHPNLFSSPASRRSGYRLSHQKNGFQVCLVLRVRACPVRSELYITHPNAKDLFRQLYKRRERIERELRRRLPGTGLCWEPLRHRKSCRIAEYRSADVEDDKTWTDLMAWFEQRAFAFHSVFSKVIPTLKV
jgi:hypothetical protein